jgi:hypothetical protein
MMKFRLLFNVKEKHEQMKNLELLQEANMNDGNNKVFRGQQDPSQNTLPKLFKQDLITSHEFMEALQFNKNLLDGFLPQNYQLKQFLMTRYSEIEINVYNKYQDDFKSFRKS